MEMNTKNPLGMESYWANDFQWNDVKNEESLNRGKVGNPYDIFIKLNCREVSRGIMELITSKASSCGWILDITMEEKH